MANKKDKLRVCALGGLNEIGKNITLFEMGDDIIVVDCGVSFPEDDMLGIDLVIPDVTYLVKNADRVRGLVLTHGHEDHIGAIPYVLKQVNMPIYATRLTLGLLNNKLKEHKLDGCTKTTSVSAGETIQLGKFKVEFIRTCHSIADSVAIAVHTDVGTVIHTGDFKVDYTPIDDNHIDLCRFAELGKKGVQLLLCESTNVERRGYTMSERSVGEVFRKIFADTPRSRILVATFSSNIHRIQQILNIAKDFNRKAIVIGRSMINAVETASELGCLTIPENTIIDISEIRNYTNEQLVIVTTGSQGETMAALSKIAYSEHKQIEIIPGDKVVFSASPIPGNEKAVSMVINELFRRGAEVVYESIMETHVSGHAMQEELKLMHTLTQPKYFMPIHGEYRHLKHHRDLAISLGMKPENIFVQGIGEVLEVGKDSAQTISEKITAGQVLVDGLGVGDVGNIVLRDRRHLSQDGLIVVVVTIDAEDGKISAGPDIISRGFVYVRESEQLIDEARNVVKEALASCEGKSIREWTFIKTKIKDVLKEFLWQKTKRSPMILPIIMEV